MIIDFEQIRSFVPGHVINEYGQLTGNYVRYADIVCVCEEGRVQIWLDRDAYDRKDFDGLICDYDEAMLRAAGWTLEEGVQTGELDEPETPDSTTGSNRSEEEA